MELNENINKHLQDMFCFFGDSYIYWFKKEGLDLFFKWAETKGLDYKNIKSEILKEKEIKKELIFCIKDLIEKHIEFAYEEASRDDRACGIKECDWIIRAKESLKKAEEL